jgi:hypothetical protein
MILPLLPTPRREMVDDTFSPSVADYVCASSTD